MDEISRNWWYRARVDLYSDIGAMKKVHYTWLPHLRIDLLEEVRFRGHFTPRGRANLLCKSIPTRPGTAPGIIAPVAPRA
jgi:hypothetical protein